MSVRKVSNRGGNIIGKFPSLKMKRMVQFESTIERDYLYVLDYEADVASFEDQPLTIEYVHDGRLLRYTPDFHVVQGGQHALIECKPQALTEREDNQRKFAAGREFATERGWEFRVVTDETIRSGWRLRNIKLLRQYACHSVTAEMKGWIYSTLHEASSPPSIGQIMDVMGPRSSMVFVSLLHMAYHHELVVPIDIGLITNMSPVHLPGQWQFGGIA